MALAACGSLGLGNVTAQLATPPAKNPWETTAAAALVVSRGNSETILGTIGIDTKRKWDDRDFAAGGSAGYGSNEDQATGNDVRTTGYLRAYAQYNQNITDRTYWGVRVDADHDGLADLDYRFRIAPLLGWYAVKKEKTTLVFEAGPAGIIERYTPTPTVPDPETDYYFALRFAERFDHKLSATTKIWQYAEYIPYVEDYPDKYLLNAEIGIATDITKKWDLRVVLEIRHDNNPPAGKEYTDTRLLAGTGYKF
jgi:putative salt-induced outer membrane protein YdiY